MAPARWFINGYLHYWDHHVLTVYANTNVACHMYLLWTDVPFRQHLRQEETRGLKKMTLPKFCFVQFTEIEQNEAGDTSVHTFTFPGWEFCMTRYWTFRATINGDDSPSNMAICQDHCEYPGTGPDYTIEILTNATDCWLGYTSAAYNIAHDAAIAMWLEDTGYSIYPLGQGRAPGYYRIRRVGLYFDIPQWPMQANIQSMNLWLYLNPGNYPPWDLYVLNAPDLHEPTIKADYGYLLTLVDPIAQVTIPDGTEGWFIIPLEQAARNLVIPGTTCKWALRSKPEIDGVVPPPHSHCTIATNDFSGFHAARIVVTYKV